MYSVVTKPAVPGVREATRALDPAKASKIVALRADLGELRRAEPSMHAVVFTQFTETHAAIVRALKSDGYATLEARRRRARLAPLPPPTASHTVCLSLPPRGSRLGASVALRSASPLSLCPRPRHSFRAARRPSTATLRSARFSAVSPRPPRVAAAVAARRRRRRLRSRSFSSSRRARGTWASR